MVALYPNYNRPHLASLGEARCCSPLSCRRRCWLRLQDGALPPRGDRATYRIKNVGQVSADIERSACSPTTVSPLSCTRGGRSHPCQQEYITGDSIDFVWTVRPKRPWNWYGFPTSLSSCCSRITQRLFAARRSSTHRATDLDLSVVKWREVIDIDPVTGRYSPMPIPFHLLVMNIGGHPTGEISVS